MSESLSLVKFTSKKQANNTLVTIEEKQIALFRNLNFKSFLIAVIGRSMESILGEKVDLSQIAFTPEASKIQNKSINDLIALWLPIVATVLAYVAHVIDKDLSELLSEGEALQNVSANVSTLIYTSQVTNPNPIFTNFKNLVSSKG